MDRWLEVRDAFADLLGGQVLVGMVGSIHHRQHGLASRSDPFAQLTQPGEGRLDPVAIHVPVHPAIIGGGPVERREPPRDESSGDIGSPSGRKCAKPPAGGEPERMMVRAGRYVGPRGAVARAVMG